MNKKQIALAVLLFDFGAFSAYVIAQHGYVGLFEQIFVNTASMQIGLDLVIALGIVSVWMWQDARRHDISPLPYLLATATLGSIGPLLYLVRRFGRDEVRAPQSALAGRAHAVRA